MAPVFISDHQLREDGVERHTESKVGLCNWVGDNVHLNLLHFTVWSKHMLIDFKSI